MSHSVRARSAARVTGLAVAVIAAGLALCVPAHAEVWRVDTRGGPRLAIVHPAAVEPAPTVIVLHGAISSAAWAERHFGFVEAAAARSFAAAFPQANAAQWNAARAPLSPRTDDVAFLRRLVVDLVERGIAEPERIYIAGVSSGGMMALRMVCEAAEMFAGAGTVIASMPVGTGAACRPARPVPVVMFNGTADALVPYHGGGIGPLNIGGFVWGAERTAAFLAHANGCVARPLTRDVSLEKTSVTRITWTGCDGDAGVVLYRVNGGRHSVLGRRRMLPAFLRPRVDMLSEAETIMAAFAGE
jgi:polyhydroxybutyrate depolymerase